MFDLTKEVILDEKIRKTYRGLQMALYVFSLLAFFYVVFLILFPTQSFVFSFLNPDASSNSITRPRNALGEPVKNGKIGANGDFYFDTSLVGNYSKLKLTFELSKKSERPQFERLVAVRSYQAFLFPDGSPIGFKDGALVKNDQKYFIISDGQLREFKKLSVVNSLGFSEKAFVDADDKDLKYNSLGSPIADDKNFPESSIFKINGNFYILKNGALQKFTSPEAFLSQYKSEQVIEKDENFLSRYKLSENPIGFSDGSLISYGDAVYLVSEGKILPVDSTITFEAAGYSWDDVIPVSADEISFYKKGKLFTLKDTHPSGTVFSTTEEGRFYIIRNGKKDSLSSAAIAYSWLRKNPVLVSQAGSQVPIFCSNLKKELLALRSYSCEMEIDALENLTGKDYEFKANFGNSVEFDTISVRFEKTVTADNLRQTLGEILNRIRNNYARQ